MVLVDGALASARADDEVLRQGCRAEQHRRPEDDEGRDVPEPGRRVRGRPLQAAGQRVCEIVVGEPRLDDRLKIGDEAFCILDVAQVGELLLDLGLGGAGVEEGDGRHEDPLGDYLVELHRGHLVRVPPDEVEHVAEHDGVRRGDDGALQVPGAREEVQERVPVVEVGGQGEPVLELGEVVLPGLRRGDARLQILAPEEHVRVLQASAAEGDAHGDADEVGRVDRDDVVVGRALRRNPRLRAERADLVVDLVVEYGEQRFDEVLLGELCAAGVHAHEYLGDILLVGLGVDLQGGKRVYAQVEQVVDVLLYDIFFLVGQGVLPVSFPALVRLADVCLPELGGGVLPVGFENRADGADPLGIALVRLRPYREFPGQGVERYPYPPHGVVLVPDLNPVHRREKRGQALLAVDHQVVGLFIYFLVPADLARVLVVLR